jgi:hypothetical protein
MRTPHLICLLSLFVVAVASPVAAQVEEDDLGAWYMYFWSTRLNDGDSRWGFQGDAQWRNWDFGGDLEQLLLRGGVTYTPEDWDATFTLGYGNITSGTFGSSNDTSRENRTYLEALLPQSLGQRLRLRHRFRYEQRWVDNQDFRTRFRYGLFADIPVNGTSMETDAIYIALYSELFINRERDIGTAVPVELFDRNRLYGGVGYVISDRLKVQGGYMRQATDSLSKDQLQFSLHHSF